MISVIHQLWIFLIFLFAMAPMSAHSASLDDLLGRLKSPSPSIRLSAAQEVGEKGTMANTPHLADLLADDDGAVRDMATQSLWKIWMRSGDPDIDSLMKKGVALIDMGKFGEAVRVFSQIIERKPNFAEGWNKRATALYLANRYQESISDCKKVLVLNPYHFGALSGLGMNYVKSFDLEAALDAFKRTLKVLPHSDSTARYIELIEKALVEKDKNI